MVDIDYDRRHTNLYTIITISEGPLHSSDSQWTTCYYKKYSIERHRLDGPAIFASDGYKEWWIDGNKYFNFQSYLEAVKPLITEQEYFILVLTYGTEK